MSVEIVPAVSTSGRTLLSTVQVASAQNTISFTGLSADQEYEIEVLGVGRAGAASDVDSIMLRPDSLATNGVANRWGWNDNAVSGIDDDALLWIANIFRNGQGYKLNIRWRNTRTIDAVSRPVFFQCNSEARGPDFWSGDHRCSYNAAAPSAIDLVITDNADRTTLVLGFVPGTVARLYRL